MESQVITNLAIKYVALYICLNNMDDLVENGNGSASLPKILNAAGVYYKYVEQFIKALNPQSDGDKGPVYVEKVTGARIHIMFPVTSTSRAQNLFWRIVAYAKELADDLNHANLLPQGKSFCINMGADYGECIHFPFNYRDIYEDNSFGEPSSKAAKLQSVAPSGQLLMSAAAESILKQQSGMTFFDKSVIDDATLSRAQRKYPGIMVTSFSLRTLQKEASDSLDRSDRTRFIDELASNNRTFFQINEAKEINLATSPSRMNGFIFYADIRGSTKMLNNKQALSVVASLQNRQLMRSVDAVLDNSLSHIQIQGDRESAYLNANDDDGYIKVEKVIESAFAAIEGGKNGLPVGVGVAYGSFYGRQVGRSNEKDNLILGKSVSRADEAEDDVAYEDNAIAIDSFTYWLAMKSNDSGFVTAMKTFFKSVRSGDFYLCKEPFGSFQALWTSSSQKENDTYDKYSSGAKSWLKL